MSLTIKDNSAKFAAMIDKLRNVRVMVGIPSGEATRTESDGSVSPVSNAVIGYVLEKGSAAQNIPARPFLAPGVADANEKTEEHLSQGAAALLGGDEAGLERELNAAGLDASSAVKAKMSAGPFKPLAPPTLAARKRRGVERTDPLIDTGNLQNHITYVIRKGK